MLHSPLDTDHDWFKKLFELSPDPTWIIDNNRFVECNEAALTALGYLNREQFLNVHPSKLSPPKQPDGEDSYAKAERMMAIAKDQGLHRFQWVHTKASGENFFAEVTLSAITLEGRNVIYCVWRDVTDRKFAEEALRESEARFRALTEMASDFYWETDAEHRITRRGMGNTNHTTSVFRRSPQIGERRWEIPYLSPDVTGWRAHRIMLDAHLPFRNFEISRLGADGNAHYVSINGDPVFDTSGQFKGYRGTGQVITARKIAEETLKESERLLRESQSIAGLGSYVLDIATGSWTSSDELDRLFGIDKTYERTIAGWAALIHPDDRARMVKYFNDEVLGQGRAFDVSYRVIRHNDQVERWVHGLGRLNFDVNKRPLTMHGSIQDITERKLAEAAIEKARRRLQIALDGSQISVWETDLRTNAIWLDAAWAAFLGLPPTETRTNAFELLNLVHPDDRQFSSNAGVQIQKGKITKYAVEHRVRAASGEWRWILSRGQVVERDAAGQPVRISGTNTDITERRQAETALRIAATAFESQEGMLITDAAKVILRVNRAFSEITGYSAEEIVGKTPNVFKSGRHDADFYAAMWKGIVDVGSWQGEIWNRRKNGEVYPEWLSISAVADDQGRVTNYVAAFSDITSRKAAADEIRNLAFYDPLTLLPNRRLLLDRLKQALASSVRSKRCGALLFVDLDNFKNLNDNLGHTIGDLLLQQVAQRLTASIREGDSVARLGGDEFVVMLEELSEHPQEAATQAEIVGEKILAALNQAYQLAGHTHYSAASIGVTLLGEHQATIDELLKQADLAMYQAKAAGRNTLRFFEPKMQAAIMTRAALEADLREATGKDQFLLHYQAQVIDDGRLTGTEVLIRWAHPRRGMISSLEFIPLAEETGLILAVGRWVLETACTQLAVWAARPEMAHLTVSVNVSARQFYDVDFVDGVLAVLASTGANPQRLKLELTESLMVQDVEDVISKMTALKAKGVGFSMDDFGTGYSSLSYLKRLPLDQLKVDQGFVNSILTDPNDAAIAKMIVALGETMGLMVIAEGVESEAQRKFLADIGCRAFQGYLFSRPLPLQEFEAFATRA